MEAQMRKYVLCIIALVVAVAVVLWERASFTASGAAFTIFRLWCDGCFVSAIVFLSVGMILLVERWGGFDSLSYSAGRLFSRFTHGRQVDEAEALGAAGGESYFDYPRRKSEERKNRKGFVDFLIVGAIMLAFSFLLLLAC